MIIGLPFKEHTAHIKRGDWEEPKKWKIIDCPKCGREIILSPATIVLGRGEEEGEITGYSCYPCLREEKLS